MAMFRFSADSFLIRTRAAQIYQKWCSQSGQSWPSGLTTFSPTSYPRQSPLPSMMLRQEPV